MLNPFPDLLALGFFAPTMLRIAAAATFAYFAYLHLRDRSSLGSRLGAKGETYIWIIIALYVLVAAGLFFGYHTQISAIAGILIAKAHLLLRRRFPMHHDLGKGLYWLLIIICLSLLFSGAGALAFDLPL